jgi:membrane associated rhomboid family serine protease
MKGQWWRIFTSSWVHADLIGGMSLHLFFNMLSLAMLGKIVEESLGRKHFCLLYFPAGLAATAFYLVEISIRAKVFGQTDYLESTLIGASGCVLGLASAFAVMHPNRLIMILPWPFPMRALTAILVFCGLSLLLIFAPGILLAHTSPTGGAVWLNFRDTLEFLSKIAHSAHLGGAVWGFVYMGLIGWYRKPAPAMSSNLPINQEELALEAAMLDSLSPEQIKRELPYLMRKLRLSGPENMSRRELAFLQKAHNISQLQDSGS